LWSNPQNELTTKVLVLHAVSDHAALRRREYLNFTDPLLPPQCSLGLSCQLPCVLVLPFTALAEYELKRPAEPIERTRPLGVRILRISGITTVPSGDRAVIIKSLVWCDGAKRQRNT